MLARFMRDTPLAAIEIEMQLIPGFKPRACGTLRSRQVYINSNYMSYEELLRLFLEEIEFQTFALRVKKLMKGSEANLMIFRNAEHKKRFRNICKSGLFPGLDESNGYAAAIFLLSADAFLWRKSKSYINDNYIHFEAIRIQGVDLAGYAGIHYCCKQYYFKTLAVRPKAREAETTCQYGG